jgi:hypothetical protein
MSPIPSIEERLAALEHDVDEIKCSMKLAQKSDWFSKVAGSFKDDADFDEVVRLGREIRQAERFEGE